MRPSYLSKEKNSAHVKFSGTRFFLNVGKKNFGGRLIGPKLFAAFDRRRRRVWVRPRRNRRQLRPRPIDKLKYNCSRLKKKKKKPRSEMSFFGVSHRIVAVHEMSLTCRRRRQDARVIFFPSSHWTRAKKLLNRSWLLPLLLYRSYCV